MPDLVAYQSRIDVAYATLRAWEKITPPSPQKTAHHAALKAALDAVMADNPGLVQPDDGDPKT
jgi:hypothetical protein